LDQEAIRKGLKNLRSRKSLSRRTPLHSINLRAGDSMLNGSPGTESYASTLPSRSTRRVLRQHRGESFASKLSLARRLT
jgi:hypothetical protein